MMAIIEDADGRALRAAIVADPDDRLARLAYADWCDDSGHSDYADYIRFALGGRGRSPRVCWRQWFDPWWAGRAWNYCYGQNHDRDMQAHRVWRFHRGGDFPVEGFVTAGGFVEYVACPLERWLEIGKDWLDRHPVCKLEISDKRPAGSGGSNQQRVWVRHGVGVNFYDMNVLPAAVFDAMPGCAGSQWMAFGDVKDAHEALGVAIKKVLGCRGGWSMAVAPF